MSRSPANRLITSHISAGPNETNTARSTFAGGQFRTGRIVRALYAVSLRHLGFVTCPEDYLKQQVSNPVNLLANPNLRA